MSRGLGRIQRRVLELCKHHRDDGCVSTFMFAALIYDVKSDINGMHWVTGAQLSAVRRALAGLRKQGKIRLASTARGHFGWELNNGLPDKPSLRAWATELGCSKSTLWRATRSAA